LLEIPDPAIVGLSNGTAFIAMQGYDGAFPGGGANPSFAMWPNGDWMLCGEGKFLTVRQTIPDSAHNLMDLLLDRLLQREFIRRSDQIE
jgi:hypothetical protein